MPGSSTTPGHTGTRVDAPARVAFRCLNGVSAQDELSFAARWLAYALPYRRFACTLAGTCARFGANAVCYSCNVRDSHPLLLADLTGAPMKGFQAATSLFPFPGFILTLRKRTEGPGAFDTEQTCNVGDGCVYILKAGVRCGSAGHGGDGQLRGIRHWRWQGPRRSGIPRPGPSRRRC